MRHLRIAATLFVALPLTACGAGHLIVEQPNSTSARAQAVTLQYDESTTSVPQDVAAYTQQKMNEAFFGGDNPPFARGQQITVRYRFVGYDAGSRLGRYLAGPLGAGEAQTVLEAQFVDPAGVVVSRVRAEGELSGGFFGGSSRSAVDKAVKEIRKYAVTAFKG